MEFVPEPTTIHNNPVQHTSNPDVIIVTPKPVQVKPPLYEYAMEFVVEPTVTS